MKYDPNPSLYSPSVPISSRLKKAFASLIIPIITTHYCVTSVAIANDIQAQNLVVGNLATVDGKLEIGRLTGVNSSAFAIDVKETTTTVEREIVIPGFWRSETTWVDQYGPTAGATTWVEDWGWVSTTQWVDEYGWTIVDYQEVIDYQTESYEEAIPAEYDADGIEISPARTETRTRTVQVGSHLEPVTGWGVVGGYSVPSSEWQVIGGHEEIGPPGWGVVGQVPTVSDVWVPEERTTTTEVVSGLPVVRFTGFNGQSHLELAELRQRNS
ncbi:MAG: hypothetical protein JNJ83_08865 [Verrucomicrobiaceae bacterium]|nr:hypothetical protein [Verrucomicrobiaceae bacterium]